MFERKKTAIKLAADTVQDLSILQVYSLAQLAWVCSCKALSQFVIQLKLKT